MKKFNSISAIEKEFFPTVYHEHRLMTMFQAGNIDGVVKYITENKKAGDKYIDKAFNNFEENASKMRETGEYITGRRYDLDALHIRAIVDATMILHKVSFE